ncbi:MAG: hypothetical protein AAF430_00585 [Myxococcota bacterium]
MSKNRRYSEGVMAPYRYPDHPRPRTRREFLAQGFITGSAWIAAPSLLGLFKSEEAKAQAMVSCGLGGAGGKLPFLIFDLGGGASIAGSNVLVGTNTQLDPMSPDGYRKMGLPADRTPADPAFIDTSMGLAFHTQSALLRGIRMRASDTTIANTNGVVFAARSDNDTGNNPLNPIYGINAAGAAGALLGSVGTRASDSGGRSTIPMSMFDPTVRPTKVDRPSEATGLVDTGKLLTLLDDPADASAVMAAAEAISGDKVAKLPETDLVKGLINCSFQETTELVTDFGDPNALDPLQDPMLTSVIAPGEFGQSEFRKTGTIMKLVLDDYAGVGTMEFGGYDYHNGTRELGERKDEIAGQQIGAALEYAALLNKPVVIYLMSDGSVFSDGAVDNTEDGDGKLVWRGDNSSTACAVLLVYDPDGRPALAGNGNQIGYYRDSASVETASSIVGDNVTALTEAVVLNYLALHNETGRLSDVLPNHILGSDTAVLDSVIGFANLPRFNT